MATATVASSTNTNIEKIGSIKVLSSASPTSSETSGLIFGGYGYSSDVQANNGDGYSISIKVISKDGKYKISSANLNATAKGSKNIIIGNFTFYDFYLVSYSIDKEVENSILTLTYKDKSIFMEKVFIGLFSYHYGNAFDSKGQFFQKPGIYNEPTSVSFQYKCTNSIYTTATLTRHLNRVRTEKANEVISSKYPSLFDKTTIIPDFLNSDAFFCQYNYINFGVNGGYIILGREELNEENCSLPEVSYCFKDLTSALAYADIPGIVDFNLGKDNEIYRILRRNYFGSLRNVLDQWGGDFGFKFYYQPKIDFKIKNYSDENSVPILKTIQEGIKLINLTSTSRTLKNLNDLFDSTSPKYDASLQKVVESLSETATLEGTRKTNVVTPIRRESRTFDSASSSLNFKVANVLPLSYLSSFYGNDPSSEDTIIGGALSIYDPQLRDVYHLWKGNYKALGISDSIGSYKILNTDSIISQLDFLLTFGPELGSDNSKLVSNYVILLAIYDEGKHSLIKDWEKSIMSEYYGQYYMLGSRNEETTSCNNLSTFSISYSTVPQSESYVGNQLPFANLLYGQFGKGSLTDYGTKKYNPIFKGENAFDAGNESRYKTFSESITDYESNKALTIINLKDNPKAKIALFSCFNEARSFTEFSNFIDTNNVSLILIKKIGSEISKISNIQLSATANSTNTSVFKIGTKTIASADNKKVCPKTVCEQTLAEAVCGDGNSNTTVNEADTGFNSTNARTITITSTTSSCNLILPVTSTYTYAETKNTNSTVTLGAATYVLGTPPVYESYGIESDNVMSHEIIDNTVPEILTQSTSSTGMVDQIVTFDDSGKNTRVLSAKDYHDKINRNLNNSVPEAFEQKKISLTSTYIPTSMVNYIFTNPILNSMNFSFNESGFNTTLDFSSRPKQPKQKDSLFLTQRFLRKL